MSEILKRAPDSGMPVPRPAWVRCRRCGWDTFNQRPDEGCRWCPAPKEDTYSTGSTIVKEENGILTVQPGPEQEEE